MSEEKSGSTADTRPVVWILVDHSSREAAFQSVAERLREEDVEAEIVTITEVLGSVAREALAGSAERLIRGLRVAVRGRSGDEDFLGAVRRARPDVLALTDARWVRALGLLESLTGIASLQVGVLADYNLAPTWLRSSVHAFVVPHEEFGEKLSAQGFPEERVLIGGPAIQSRFAADLDVEAVREEFGFGDEKVVLVRADTFGTAILEKLVFQCGLAEGDLRFIFHHNGDQSAAATLRRAAAQYGVQAAMFGRVDDLQRYIAVSDLVIAAPHEPYTAEIMALDCPVIFAGPEGDHAAQVDFLTGFGAARHVGDILRLGSELDRFTADEDLSTAREAAAELSQQEGSEQVARALLETLAHREEWRAPVIDTPTEEPPPGDDDTPDDEERPSGPFEEIGGRTSAGGGGEKGGSGEPDYSGISQAEAKEQLAALIMSERDLERKLGDIEKQQQRWRNRLELAREWNEEDLAAEAEGILRGYMDEAERLKADLESIQRQKKKLKAAAHGRDTSTASGGEEASDEPGSRPAEMENRFRKMEVDSDLEDLKDRIRKELGE